MQSNTKERASAELAAREAALLATGQLVGAAPAPVVELGDAAPALDLSHLMARPEIKAAIAAAASEAALKIVAELDAKRADAGTSTATGDRAFVESLALSINELIDQGRPNAKRTVAPAVLAMRRAARDRMGEAILDARARGIVPEYQLTAPVYLSETWIKPTVVGHDHVQRAQHIKWPLVPSEAMRPVDDTAREIHRLFCESIGAATVPKAQDPLVTGFEVVGQDRRPPETGHGRSPLDQWAVQIRDTQPGNALAAPVHILGTIADPARPTGY